METSTSRTGNTPEVEKKEVYSITVTNPADFDSCEEKRITTTKEMAMVINSMFVEAYRDFVGSAVSAVQVAGWGWQMVVYLHFEILSDTVYADAASGKTDDVFAFLPMSKTNANLVDRLKVMATPIGGQNSTVQMTQDGKDGLSQFIYSNGKKIDWSRFMKVSVVGGRTYITITGFSLDMMVEEVFGHKDAEGSKYSYKTVVGNIIRQDMAVNVNAALPNFVLDITRLKQAPLSRAAELAGLVTFDNAQVPMVRARS